MKLEAPTLTVADAPAIPGLSFRGFRGPEDFPIMAEIITAANLSDKIEEVITTESVEQNYKNIQRSDTAHDMLFAEIEGQPVGYGRCMWSKELGGDYLYSFFIHMKPEGRIPGLGEAIAAGFMQRLREIAAEHPTDAPKYFQTWADSTQEWYISVLTSQGFEIVRYGIEMVRPCSQPIETTPLPDGLEIRTPTPEQFRQVWEAGAEAFRDHWGYVERTEKDYQSWLEFPYFNPTLWKIAWEGDEVVGMVQNFINPEENEFRNCQRGYTEDISVRRPWRRMGVARSLLTQSIKMFQEMGMDETCLGVDTQNPNGALQLYESVGYEEYRRILTYHKTLVENETGK